MPLITDLINLNCPSIQQFSITNATIDYVSKNSGFKLYKNLMKSCKALKLLQLRQRIIQFENLFTVYDNYEFLIGHCQKYSMHSKSDILHAQTVKVDSCLMIEFLHPKKFYSLIPKLDLSGLQFLCVMLKFEVDLEIMEKFLTPSLEDLTMKLIPSKRYHPILLAFKRCPKLSKFCISYPHHHPIITPDILKSLLLMKTNHQMDICSFSPVADIDPMDVLQFMKIYLKNNDCAIKHRLCLNGKIHLAFSNNFAVYSKLMEFFQNYQNDNPIIHSNIHLFSYEQGNSYWKQF